MFSDVLPAWRDSVNLIDNLQCLKYGARYNVSLYDSLTVSRIIFRSTPKLVTLNGIIAILWCFLPKKVGFRANHVILAEARPILSATKM